MNILKLTDKPAELEAVKDKVLEELQFLRSLDTAGDGGHSLFSFRLHQTNAQNLLFSFSNYRMFIETAHCFPFLP